MTYISAWDFSEWYFQKYDQNWYVKLLDKIAFSCCEVSIDKFTLKSNSIFNLSTWSITWKLKELSYQRSPKTSILQSFGNLPVFGLGQNYHKRVTTGNGTLEWIKKDIK